MARRQLGLPAMGPTDTLTLGDVLAQTAFRGVGRFVDGDINPMTSNSEVSLSFTATQYDVGGYTSGITGDTILKVPSGLAGRHRLDVRYLADNANSSGGIALLVRINGSVFRELPLTVAAGAGTAIATTSDLLTLAAGDWFSCTYYANVSGMVLRSSGTRTTQLLLQRL